MIKDLVQKYAEVQKLDERKKENCPKNAYIFSNMQYVISCQINFVLLICQITLSSFSFHFHNFYLQCHLTGVSYKIDRTVVTPFSLCQKESFRLGTKPYLQVLWQYKFRKEVCGLFLVVPDLIITENEGNVIDTQTEL